ncbi:hypothetical protein [Mycobacteroides abscessus]|nr:hypothetical protein [Mycobacteroides abscessus]WJJ55966.1 hypothetical protein PROPHIT491_30 [Mycobacterium phage prophiT49-1]MBL3737096.1 hypothetical protein [Mycobacteroides abscessus subsp. massiliense]MBL3744213.1 hypothetical protein [Mycobacteroides abscessus subsp. massiliense]MBL3761349.1 hypothetical protein [Mycobacteroides abscessus subsp. massiliense]MBN7483108.1 hypothetical protein [Mycobacteroides abscessus subsp. massiliense]
MITMEHHDFVSLAKIVNKKLNPLLNIITLDLVPYEGTIHPYPLAFDPPLIEHATTDAGRKGFRHIWEKLNYAFALPDPTQFPGLPALTAEDRVILERFVQMCRRLAGYSAINDDSRLSYKFNGSIENTEYNIDYPSEESFAAAAVCFRQLHSGREAAPFDKAKGRLSKAVQQLPEKHRSSANDILEQWKAARGKLMTELLDTIVCRKAAPPNPPPNFPISYYNIHPEDLITTFQYGDVIHFTDRRENLKTLTENSTNAAYYRYAVLLAITALSHLYFGFALLIEAAMSTRD